MIKGQSGFAPLFLKPLSKRGDNINLIFSALSDQFSGYEKLPSIRLYSKKHITDISVLAKKF